MRKIEDLDSKCAAEAERTLSFFVDSGCRFPVGALAEKKDNKLILNVIVYSVDGSKSINVEITGDILQAAELGKQAALELEERGVAELAKNWREKVEEWNKK